MELIEKAMEELNEAPAKIDMQNKPAFCITTPSDEKTPEKSICTNNFLGFVGVLAVMYVGSKLLK